MLQSQSSAFSKASPLVHDAMLAEEDQRQQKFKHKMKISLKVTSNSFSWLRQSCKNIKLSWSKNWPLGFVSTVLQTSLLQWCFMGKMLLRPRGNFLAQYHKWPHGKNWKQGWVSQLYTCRLHERDSGVLLCLLLFLFVYWQIANKLLSIYCHLLFWSVPMLHLLGKWKQFGSIFKLYFHFRIIHKNSNVPLSGW